MCLAVIQIERDVCMSVYRRFSVNIGVPRVHMHVGPGVRNRPTSIGRDDDENPSVDGTLCINKPRGQVGTCYREERSE